MVHLVELHADLDQIGGRKSFHIFPQLYHEDPPDVTFVALRCLSSVERHEELCDVAVLDRQLLWHFQHLLDQVENLGHQGNYNSIVGVVGYFEKICQELFQILPSFVPFLADLWSPGFRYLSFDSRKTLTFVDFAFELVEYVVEGAEFFIQNYLPR